MRDTTIRLSDNEKELLDKVAELRFGTSDVPYGHIVKELCKEEIGRQKAEKHD